MFSRLHTRVVLLLVRLVTIVLSISTTSISTLDALRALGCPPRCAP